MRYLKNYELNNMKGKNQYDKESFEVAIKEVYDSLDKSEFTKLLDNCIETIRSLSKSGKVKQVKRTDGNPPDMIFEDKLKQLSYDVFLTVYNSRKISFKQFKVLSAFSKTDWLKKEEEYKQF